MSTLLAALVLGGCSSDNAPAGEGDSLPNFSFFVTSQKALQELSGHELGFGGDLRFGESGPGAGLRGADKICAALAERSMPGAAAKQWRAFLSVTDDGGGQPVDAIDRIGTGPWYDRLGRVVALSRADLLHDRPQNADPVIQNDLPNEDGIPNSQLDPGIERFGSNHHTMTGSTAAGTLYPPRCPAGDTEQCVDECMAGGESRGPCVVLCLGPAGDVECAAPASSTCRDWTTAEGAAENGRPRVGLSWPRPGWTEGHGGRWLSEFSATGCAPANSGAPAVGQPGSYGGFYCFALAP